MKKYPPLTDEQTVVAFLSGIDAHRDAAASYLAHSPSARELLCMAQEALEALYLPAVLPPPTQANHPAEA